MDFKEEGRVTMMAKHNIGLGIAQWSLVLTLTIVFLVGFIGGYTYCTSTLGKVVYDKYIGFVTLQDEEMDCDDK